MAVDIGFQRMLGWLLRSNRLLSNNDHRLRSGKEFARLFRQSNDPELAPSQITRWERGETPVSRDIVRRYEDMLGLTPESLVTVGDAIHRADRAQHPGRTRSWNALTRRQDDHSDLQELLERARYEQSMDGLHWSTLGDLVRGSPDLLVLPTSTWDIVTGRLLAELVVADHREWLLRQEAISKLIEHPVAARYALHQCIDLVRDPGTPAVLEPMSLLDVTRHPEATTYLLGQLAEPDNERAFHAATLTVRQKALRGHFNPGQLATITTVSEQRAGDGWDLPVWSLPRNPGSEASSAAGRWPTLHPVSGRVADKTIAAVADAREDELLPYVIDQAVFDPDQERRMLSAMCLAATPYQVPVADALIDEVRRDLVRRGQQLPPTVLRTLTTMATDVHRPLIRHILTTPAFPHTLREAAAWALPHCVGRFPEPVWCELLTRYRLAWSQSRSAHVARVLEGIAYGVGTDGYRTLTGQIRLDNRLPTAVRQTAAWLHRARASRPES